MKKLKVILAIVIVYLSFTGCSREEKLVYYPSREADVSYDESFKDLDVGKLYNLNKNELKVANDDVMNNDNWTEFDSKAYRKIVNGVLENKIIDDMQAERNDRILKPFDYSGSFYCIYDNNKKIVIGVDNLIVDTDLNVDLYIFDTSNKVIYKFSYSI